MSRCLRNLCAACVLTLVLSASPAQACPNCKLANETSKDLPRAYMYSILFMIGMPATIFTGFGISFYRLTRTAQRAAADSSAAENTSDIVDK
ncbi:MAG: hypothetical protein R3C59_13600 [Planctomycetaceae bacterium]